MKGLENVIQFYLYSVLLYYHFVIKHPEVHFVIKHPEVHFVIKHPEVGTNTKILLTAEK